MQRFKKLSGFTLIELVVVMGLTSIVVGIIYSIFSIISTQFQNNQSSSTQYNELSLFRMMMNEEFRTSDSIHFQNHILVLHQADSTIQYTMDEQSIIREINGRIDSLAVNVYDVQMIAHPKKTTLIQQAEFHIQTDTDSLRLIFYKNYAADAFLNTSSDGDSD